MSDYKQFLKTLFEAYEAVDPRQVADFIDVLEQAFHKDRMIFMFGNGGSGAAASHFCEDLGKGTLCDTETKRRFRVMSLTDNTPYILAWANDNGYETIFEQQLRNFAGPGDVALGISGSGNSENVIRAIQYANSIGMTTTGFTGYDGGRLGKLVACQVYVPSFDMGIVESVHSTLIHHIVTVLKERLACEMKG